jgi:membrane carboxypeptidase/penicillin-binding protein
VASPPGGLTAATLQVRQMMRAVVTAGTATALNGLDEVRGKTGTAEFTNDGSRAHGWFVGYRGGLNPVFDGSRPVHSSSTRRTQGGRLHPPRPRTQPLHGLTGGLTG